MRPKLPRQNHIHCYQCGMEIHLVSNATRVRITQYKNIGMCGETNYQWATTERWYCPLHSFDNEDR